MSYGWPQEWPLGILGILGISRGFSGFLGSLGIIGIIGILGILGILGIFYDFECVSNTIDILASDRVFGIARDFGRP